jgi:hypothetical protein
MYVRPADIQKEQESQVGNGLRTRMDDFYMCSLLF